MDKKNHGAFVHLTRPGLTHAQLVAHFRHEFHTYVRDFPVLLARVLGQGPPADVRDRLAENIYEEQTGKLSLGRPHPELFLEMMTGLGISREEIESAGALADEAIAYRAFLDDMSLRPPWQIGCAVLTVFVEGSVHERAEMEGRRQFAPVEDAIREHPMVKYYGCAPEKMLLLRAHRAVEGAHRQDAWASVLDHTPVELAESVAQAVETSLARWLAYRDGVARKMGVPVLPVIQ
jgi:pyrroloquinoline quinone (PQQ) biosynthesis protein C